ncbi:MAG: PAS domain-containing protein [Candidatus Eremiobacteraeota bacterium]|nr:PAS domain-containing protein [Candidatus Eremiobacteraeota bacterium]MCW5865924.1 PAS domain-containing protein [Candidatus Eremiobacteraeota bacterium]
MSAPLRVDAGHGRRVTLELGNYLDDLRVVLLDCVDQGEMLFLRWNVCGTSRSGREVVWPGSGLVRFEGDRIAGSETFFDYLSLLKQLDLIPARIWQTLSGQGVVRGESLSPEQRWMVRQGPELSRRRIVLMPGAILRHGSIHRAVEACQHLVPLGVLVPGGSTIQDDRQSEFLLEGSEFGILIVDGRERILEANRTFLTLVGESIEAVAGSFCGDWLSAPQQPAQNDLVSPVQVRLNGLSLEMWTSRLERPDEEELYLRAFREPAREWLNRVVQQHERQREILAYDLHDGLAQDLASLWVSLQARELLARREGSPGHDRQLQQVQRMLLEVRSLLRELQNPFQSAADLTEALQEWATHHGLEIRLEPVPLEPLAGLLCYRMLTEALSLFSAGVVNLRLARGEGMISMAIQGKVHASPSADLLDRLKVRCKSLRGEFAANLHSEGISSLRLSLADPECWGMGET